MKTKQRLMAASLLAALLSLNWAVAFASTNAHFHRIRVYDRTTSEEPVQNPKVFKTPLGSRSVAIRLNTSDIRIEGHSGTELIIEATGFQSAPDRAKGLTPIYSNVPDNTGLGLGFEQTDQLLTLAQSHNNMEVKYLIKVPFKNGVSLVVGYQTATIEVTRMNGEIDINGKVAHVKLDMVTGPLMVHCISGDIEAHLSALSQVGPSSLVSTVGFVDISLPANTKADLKLRSIKGELFVANPSAFAKQQSNKDNATNPNIGQASKPNQSKDNKDNNAGLSYGATLEGRMNGGGVKLSMESVNGNLYLREH